MWLVFYTSLPRLLDVAHTQTEIAMTSHIHQPIRVIIITAIFTFLVAAYQLTLSLWFLTVASLLKAAGGAVP